jgi:hypothetical protein
MGTYNRSLEELKQHAVRFWSDELKQLATDVSVLPLLIESQEKFLSILTMADSSPEAWAQALPLSTLSGNLFLKHLMVLSDLGGEALNKVAPLSTYFPSGRLEYFWKNARYFYSFTDGLSCKSFANSSLKVDGRSIIRKPIALNPKMRDVVMLILFGAQSLNNNLPNDIRARCVIGDFIGRADDLEKFVRQSYIRISRQIGGADSNALGQLAQKYVLDSLREFLPETWQLQSNGGIPGVGHNDSGTDSTFDVVVLTPSGLRFGIEISFQFTTNSVIERKAAQARERQVAVHHAKHFIAYVLDGAGNIDIRAVASRTICSFSDCTVAFSRSEIQHLAHFMLEKESAR